MMGHIKNYQLCCAIISMDVHIKTGQLPTSKSKPVNIDIKWRLHE